MFIFVFCSDSLLSSVKYGVPQAGIRVYEVRDSFDLRGMGDSGCLPDSEISTERSVRWQRESICGSESCCGMNSEKFL